MQILQDVRSILLHGDVGVSRFLTLRESRAFPILITVVLLFIALWLHARESPRFAEVA